MPGFRLVPKRLKGAVADIPPAITFNPDPIPVSTGSEQTVDGSINPTEEIVWFIDDTTKAIGAEPNDPGFYSLSGAASTTAAIQRINGVDSILCTAYPDGIAINFDVSEWDLVQVTVHTRSSALRLNGQITCYCKDSGGNYIYSGGDTLILRGTLFSNSTVDTWEEFTQLFRIPSGLGIAQMVLNIGKAPNSVSPTTTGNFYIAGDVQIRKGLSGIDHAPETKQTFSGTNCTIDSLGNFKVKPSAGGTLEDFIPFGIMARSSAVAADYVTYAGLGFNFAAGWLGGAMSHANNAGIYFMGQVNQYVNNAGLTASLASQVSWVTSQSYYWRAFLTYFDDEYWSYYDTSGVNSYNISPLAIYNELDTNMPEVPLYWFAGNPGTMRHRQAIGHLTGTYLNQAVDVGDSPRYVEPPSALNSLYHNSLQGMNLHWNLPTITTTGDIHTNESLRAMVYAALATGAKGIFLFKDGIATGTPDVGQEWDIQNMVIASGLPTLINDVTVTLKPLILKPHWVDWGYDWDHKAKCVVGAKNYNGRGHLFISNLTNAVVSLTITIDTTNLYTPGNLLDFFDDSSVATPSISGDKATYIIALGAYGSKVVYIDKTAGTDVSDISSTPLFHPRHSEPNEIADTSQFKVHGVSAGSTTLYAKGESEPNDSFDSVTINIT